MKNYFLLFLIFVLVGCSSNQPVNLRTAKDLVKDYYESGKYDEEMNEIIKDAEEKFSKVVVKNNSAVIFDVDDTALSNYEISKKLDYGYDFNIIQEWVLNAKLPAIKQTKGLYDFLKSKNVKLIFLTGRTSEEYDATYRNLIEQGYTGFDTLIVRNDEQKKTEAQTFKSDLERRLQNLVIKLLEQLVISGLI